ncbi:Methyl sulfide methyltransferase-associated sensor [Candidatus Gugararchaeum adminiculabundum]|nr:Methyl sulfide methyltransferase-associated sensor [Candidatus Gugararchaeum adminiculabundum]
MKLRYRLALIVFLPLLLVLTYQVGAYQSVIGQVAAQDAAIAQLNSEILDINAVQQATMDVGNARDDAILALISGDSKGAAEQLRMLEGFEQVRLDAMAQMEKDEAGAAVDEEKKNLQERMKADVLKSDASDAEFGKKLKLLAQEPDEAKRRVGIVDAIETYDNAVDPVNSDLMNGMQARAKKVTGEIAGRQAEIAREKEEGLRLLYIVAITSIVIFGVVILSIDATVNAPVRNITDSVRKITKGDFDVSIRRVTITELEDLGESLNRVLASFKLAVLRAGMTREDMGIGEALKAKEEAENRYRALYESSADALMTIEPPDWKFTAGNQAAVRLYGVKDEQELTALGPWDVSPEFQPDGKRSSDMAKKMIEKAMKEGSSFFEWTHRKYRGESFPSTVLLTRVKIGGKDVVQATVRDISERKRAEEELLRSKTLTQAALDAVTDIFYVFELGGNFKLWNRKLKEVSEYSDRELATMNPRNLLSGKDLELMLVGIAKAVKEGSGVVRANLTTKSGKRIPYEFTGAVVKDADGKMIGMAGSGRKI